MKVCMLTTGFPRFEGDLFGGFVLELIRELRSKRIDVAVVAPHEHGLRTVDFVHGVEVRRFRYFLPRFQRLAYGGGIPANLGSSWLARFQVPFFLFAFLFAALRACRDSDIVHCHWTITGLIAIWATKRRRLPLVVSVRGSDINLMASGFMRCINKYVYGGVDCVLAVSDDISRKLQAADVERSKIEIVYNGVDKRFKPIKRKTSRRVLGLPQDGFLVLYVGLMSPIKGVDRLLRAVQLIDDDSLYCAIVGDGPSRIDMEALASRSKMRARFLFAGAQSTDTIPIWMNAADVFVLPSLSEGRPNVVLEAQACGVPVVATNVGGTPELITNEETGLLVEKDNARALADSIRRLMDSESLRVRLGQQARRHIQEDGLTWSSCAEKVSVIYQSLLEIA